MIMTRGYVSWVAAALGASLWMLLATNVVVVAAFGMNGFSKDNNNNNAPLLVQEDGASIPTPRRFLLQQFVVHASILTTTTTNPAYAARGAAELDLEFYLRDVWGGNRKEGNIDASPPPILPDPRRIPDRWANWMYQTWLEELWREVVKAQDSPQTTTTTSNKNNKNNPQSPTTTTTSPTTTISFSSVSDLQAQIESFRATPSVQRSFAVRAPWRDESLTDQYYFDLTAYCVWRVAGSNVLPVQYRARDRFVRRIGRAIYQKVRDNEEWEAVVTNSASSSNNKNTGVSLVATNEATRAILDWFQSIQFYKEYRIVTEGQDANNNNSNNNQAASVIFDHLDDEALRDGASVNILVTVVEPATLGACLQITGEQSRFIPDLVGPTLAALWQDQVGGSEQSQHDSPVDVSWETFFVDPVYRPNPKDYFPSEQLCQFTITLK